LRGEQISTAEDLAKWWSGHLEGVRTGLYEEVIDGANEDIKVRVLRQQAISHLVIALAEGVIRETPIEIRRLQGRQSQH
jgi:hypothetical protein